MVYIVCKICGKQFHYNQIYLKGIKNHIYIKHNIKQVRYYHYTIFIYDDVNNFWKNRWIEDTLTSF